MSPLHYLRDIPIDVPHTLNQLLNKFRSVRHGLPELLKNSKDQYSRLGVTEREARVVLILIDTERHRLGVLDFAGASNRDFDAWKTWSDRRANRRDLADDIEGGNGNGGKGFMCNGSRTLSTFESIVDGRFTRMGFNNQDEDHRFYPAYATTDGGSRLQNVAASDPRTLLADALSAFGLTIDGLPECAQRVLASRCSYTLVRLDDVRDWYRKTPEEVRRRVLDIASDLGVHPQAAMTLESCRVLLAVDGQFLDDELGTRQLDPLAGFDALPAIPVPAQLPDPTNGELIDTGSGDAATKFLQLQTSQQSLRMEETRPLNVIRVWNGRNIVANWPVADLFSRAESAYICGRLSLPEFAEQEHLSGADRDSLADTSLVLAVRHWVSQQVEELAERIQASTAQEHSQDDRDNANDTLDRLRDLMREFLDSDQSGDESQGTGGPGSGGNGDGPRRGERVDELVLENESVGITVAAGTSVPLVCRAYEIAPDDKRLVVQGAALTFCTDTPDLFDFADGQLSARGPGTGHVWFSHEPSELESHKLQVESIPCTDVSIDNVPDRLLLQGERVSLRIVLHTAEGPRSDCLFDATVDETNMGIMSRTGVYTAPGREGTATIRVKYGPNNEDTGATSITVGTERVTPRPRRNRPEDGGGANADIPHILLCGTPVPGTEDRPPEFRTVQPSNHEPTIIDFEPDFENVIFVNPDSKEATQVRAGRGGRRGTAGIGTKTFGHFLALKCFEILKRLKVFQENLGSSMDARQFREAFAMAEQECAQFIERAYELGQAIADEHARRENG